MKFNLIDKIETLSDERIVAVKYVSLAEEYLEDHFPTFPVLPGVMMIEAIAQAAGWLLQRRRHFAKPMTVIREVKNVKYGRFIFPGDFLRLEVDFSSDTPTGAVFKASGRVGEDTAVSGRIEMSYFCLGEKQPELAYFDQRLLENVRRRYEQLRHGSVNISGI